MNSILSRGGAATATGAPYSSTLSQQDIREKRTQDIAKGALYLTATLFLGHLAQHAVHKIIAFDSFSDVCVNLYAGILLGLNAAAAASFAYQCYLSVTAPDGIQNPNESTKQQTKRS